jgi:hypothetical protein
MLSLVIFHWSSVISCPSALRPRQPPCGLLHSVLFEVNPYDPVAFIGAPLLMLAIAAATAFIPTRQVMRVNPMFCAPSDRLPTFCPPLLSFSLPLTN